MNCFEFRKHCVAEPRSTDAAYRRHREECASCAAFAQHQDGFERALAQAVHIDVPPELEARLILRQTTRHACRLKRTLAYAASILVVLGVAITSLWGLRSPDVAAIVMSHILDEPEHLMVQDEVPPDRVAAVLAQAGMALRGDLGLIRFAALCPGRPGVHLVLAGRHGPVTVMIMPTTPVFARRVVAHGGLSGVIVPNGAGSLAVVGLPGEPIGEYERRVRATVSELT